jgi:pyruvate/2-oxoacid:ferredoxin oxidoreductase alpha subunit
MLVVAFGGAAGTARVVVDAKREEGIKAGLVKIRLFRPFPRKRLAEVLRGKKAIGVIDRSVCFGWNCGPMYMELKALSPETGVIPMLSYIGGMANLDITIPHIERVVDETYAAARGKPYQEVTWIPLEE